MISRRIIINVLTFIVLSAVLIVALIVSVFRVQPKYSIYATFADSGGVFTNQEVTYRGVTVGQVGTLRIVPMGVRIQLVINKTFDKIPKDGTHARVMFKSAVGEQFVDILPRVRTGPYFRPGDDIPMSATELPVQQEDLLRLLDAVLAGVPPTALHDLVEALGTGLSGRGGKLHTALAALDPLTQTLAARTAALNDLNVNADSAGAAFDASAPDFVSGINGLGTTSQALGRGAPGLSSLLDAGANYLPDIAGLIAARKAELNGTIANLAVVTRISYQHLKSVENTLDWLPVFLDALVGSYDSTTNRFRFGQILTEIQNPPCSYGTPRRNASQKGNAANQPVLDFSCH
jgi:phospholipid/cholesterol/gamma-HCH transport system substrate-binding protein